MKTKLREIRTTRRVGSVSRKDIRAAVKAVAAERTPEMERLIRGEASAEETARAIGEMERLIRGKSTLGKRAIGK